MFYSLNDLGITPFTKVNEPTDLNRNRSSSNGPHSHSLNLLLSSEWARPIE